MEGSYQIHDLAMNTAPAARDETLAHLKARFSTGDRCNGEDKDILRVRVSTGKDQTGIEGWT